MYHRICRDTERVRQEFIVTESVFASQMRYLASHGYGTVPLRSMVAHPGGRGSAQVKAALLTFDDGYRDNLEIAMPILRRFGFHAAVFLVGRLEQMYNWWDSTDGLRGAELLKGSDLADMERHGIEFGSHTMSHASLPDLDDDSLKEELVRSKERLEMLLGHSVSSIAYPYGDVNPRVKSAARAAGYTMGFATNTGPLSPEKDWFEIRRIPMHNRCDRPYMAAKLFGFDRAYRWTKWSLKRIAGKRNLYQSELRQSSLREEL
jgi:peptidoglycan/xylan/chitin deacetylase (PgdA/CDA1 family)